MVVDSVVTICFLILTLIPFSSIHLLVCLSQRFDINIRFSNAVILSTNEIHTFSSLIFNTSVKNDGIYYKVRCNERKDL